MGTRWASGMMRTGECTISVRSVGDIACGRSLTFQLVSLFLAHRESAWFIERYSEVQTHVATRKRLNREGRVPRARAFLEALGRGDYDDVTYDQGQCASVAYAAC